MANIHSILAYGVPGTQDVGLPTKSRCNFGPASQLTVQCRSIIYDAGPTLIHHWLLHTLRKHGEFIQCCFNVDPQSSTLAQHWNSIGWLYRVFWLLHGGDYDYADVMLGHCLHARPTLFQSKPFKLNYYIYSWSDIFSEDFSKDGSTWSLTRLHITHDPE